MSLPLWVISYCAVAYIAYFLGHFSRELKDILLTVKNRLYELKTAQEKAEKPKSGIAEPMTPAEIAADLDQERIRILNNKPE